MISRYLVSILVVGASAALACAQGETLQALGPAGEVIPIRIGRLEADGTVSEWMDYGTGGTRGDCARVEVWDAFDQDGTGYPCCGEGCGMQGGSRWYFGPTYCVGYHTNDMEYEPGPDYAERVGLAFAWSPPVGENMAMIVEFFTDFDATCTVGDDGLGDFLGGVQLDFGFADPGDGYYWTDVELCGLDWLPYDADGNMGFNIWLATYDDADPDTLFPATCAQMMLWGTNNPGSDGPGTQGPIQWDDNAPVDWVHSVPDECYDYNELFDVCPDPLCAMALFYAADGDGDEFPCGLSGLGILLANWGCTGDCVGDIDGDGRVGHSDLGIFLVNWGWDCPNGPGCDGDSVEVLGFEVLEVDNSSVQPGDDPQAPEFAGGVSHFTFDLRVIVNEGNDWIAAEMEIVFAEHRLRFFYHPLGDRTPNPVDIVDAYPATEFDTVLMSTRADAGNKPEYADPDGMVGADFHSTSFVAEAWFGIPPNGGEGEFTVARFTIEVLEGSPIVPDVVPAGAGGDAPVIGVLDGTGMSTETWGDCNEFAFDLIVGECRGDLDGDYDIDQSDLGILLSDWGCTSNCAGDLDGDDDVDHGDLGILLAYFGQSCW